MNSAERQTISRGAGGGAAPMGDGLIGLGVLSVCVNLALMLVKIATGVIGHSQALVADGIESAADVVTSMFTWAGFRLSLRPADENHPFGHGKIESLAGIVSGGCLVAAAGFIVTSSIAEILRPSSGPAWFTLPVLVVVVIVKELVGRRILAAGDELDSSAITGDAWHHRSDAITSAAAAAGISVALAGGRGFETADDWAALAACGVILANGFAIGGRALHDLLDGSVPEDLQSRVLACAGGVGGVENVEKCRIRKSGVELYVELHTRVDPGITVEEGHRIAHRVKDALRRDEKRIVDVLVHVEPAYRAPQSETG